MRPAHAHSCAGRAGVHTVSWRAQGVTASEVVDGHGLVRPRTKGAEVNGPVVDAGRARRLYRQGMSKREVA